MLNELQTSPYFPIIIPFSLLLFTGILTKANRWRVYLFAILLFTTTYWSANLDKHSTYSTVWVNTHVTGISYDTTTYTNNNQPNTYKTTYYANCQNGDKLEIESKDDDYNQTDYQKYYDRYINQPVSYTDQVEVYTIRNLVFDFFPVEEKLQRYQYQKLIPSQSKSFVYEHFFPIKVFSVGFPTDLSQGETFAFEEYLVNEGSKSVNTDWNWNWSLTQTAENTYLKTKANIQFYIVNSNAFPTSEFADLAMNHWRGGSWNDVNIFIAVNPWPQISWVKVKLGSTDQGNEILIYRLETAIKQLETVNPETVTNLANNIVQEEYHYIDPSYFENQAKPNNLIQPYEIKSHWILTIIFNLIGLFIFFFFREENNLPETNSVSVLVNRVRYSSRNLGGRARK